MTDTDDTPPTLGRCDYCNWQVMFATVAAKTRGEEKHQESFHGDVFPDTDEVCEELVVKHSDDFEVVVSAFRAAAARHGGEVDQNFVRRILPMGLNPRVVSAAYRVMRTRARQGGTGLVKVGTNVSDDTRGRNAGREQPLYRWVENERTQTA